MPAIEDLRVKIYADGANREEMLALAQNPLIKGFTTNPTLMRRAGITDYKGFATTILGDITDRPISFEVFSDSLEEMEAQAREIASWGENVYVKIPVTNTLGEPTTPVLQELASAGVKLNVTAIFTLEQVSEVCRAVGGRTAAVVSVFAGRIADSGVDPVPLMRHAHAMTSRFHGVELLWASPREVLNVFQASDIGCEIITVTNGILSKLGNVGKDLVEFSRETVQMFRDDSVAAGFCIETTTPLRRAA